jgi:hypothetical protein
MLKMKKKCRFSRQFNRACAEFKIFEGSNHFLVPVDTDYPHLLLLLALQKRSERYPQSSIKAVHLYSSAQPVSDTISFLSQFCRDHGIPFSAIRADLPSDRVTLKQLYYETALSLNATKVALSDSLDYIDATLLSSMAFEGIFSGPPVCEVIQSDTKRTPVTFVRPLCLLTDDEIAAEGRGIEFPDRPTGITVAEEPFMETARRALVHMLGDGNVRLNFFNAQFRIEKKYVGDGTVSGPDD